MAIGYRGAGGAATRASSNTTALSVAVPAATALGDLMLLVASSAGATNTITTPSGWTSINGITFGTNQRSVLYWKLAGASEGPVSLGTPSACFLDAAVVGFTGVDQTTPLDASGTWAASSGTTTLTVPAITTATANAWRVVVAVDTGSGFTSSSFPSGWTQRWLEPAGSAVVGQYVTDSLLAAAAGSQASTTFTKTSSTQAFNVIEVAVRALASVTPTADFTGTPTSGTASLSVAFSDSSAGTPTSWAWDFGDGGTSTSQNPTHSYTTSGVFTVTLVATNSSGSDTRTRTAYVSVSEAISYAVGGGIFIY